MRVVLIFLLHVTNLLVHLHPISAHRWQPNRTIIAGYEFEDFLLLNCDWLLFLTCIFIQVVNIVLIIFLGENKISKLRNNLGHLGVKRKYRKNEISQLNIATSLLIGNILSASYTWAGTHRGSNSEAVKVARLTKPINLTILIFKL